MNYFVLQYINYISEECHSLNGCGNDGNDGNAPIWPVFMQSSFFSWKYATQNRISAAAYLTSLGESWSHWIGLTDAGAESGFIWSDGSPVRKGDTASSGLLVYEKDRLTRKKCSFKIIFLNPNSLIGIPN
jgi:hypothetical protein